MAGLTVTAGTLALWHCHETSSGTANFVDATGSYPLTVVSGSTVQTMGQAGGARRFRYASPAKASGSLGGVGGPVDVALTTGSWKLQFCVTRNGGTNYGSSPTIVGITDDTSGQYDWWWVSYDNARRLSVRYWAGSHGYQTINSHRSYYDGRPIFFTYVMLVTGSTRTVQLYVNGLFEQQWTGLPPPNESGSSACKMLFGNNYANASSGALDADLEEVRIATDGLTAADIKADFLAVMPSFAAPVATWPLDTNTIAQYDFTTDLAANNAASDIGSPLTSPRNQSFYWNGGTGTNLDGSMSGRDPVMIQGVSGFGRGFGSNAGGHYSSAPGTVFLNVSIDSAMTAELMVLCPTLPGSTSDVWLFQKYPATYAPARIQVDNSGYVIFTINPSNAGSQSVTSSTPVFPSTSWVHVRAVFDNGAGQLRLYAGTPGSVPTLVGTTTLTGTPTFVDGDWSQMFLGLPVAGSGVDKFRMSSVVRTEAYPIGGATVSPPTFTAAQGTGNQVLLTFSKAILATTAVLTPATYTITGSPALTVSSVSAISGTQIALNLANIGDYSGSYTVGIPANTVYSTDAGIMGAGTAPFSMTITGNNPHLVSVTGFPDIHTVQVVYSKAMDPVSAGKITNYSISSGITITAVTRISDTIFNLTTSGETPSTTYTLTCSSAITDTLGNPLS